MKVYIACGTDSCNEPVAFHVFLDKNQADNFAKKKNLEKYDSSLSLYYHTDEGEFHGKEE